MDKQTPEAFTPMAATAEKATYNLNQAAELLGKDRNTVRRWIANGTLNGWKDTGTVHGDWVIPADAVADRMAVMAETVEPVAATTVAAQLAAARAQIEAATVAAELRAAQRDIERLTNEAANLGQLLDDERRHRMNAADEAAANRARMTAAEQTVERLDAQTETLSGELADVRTQHRADIERATAAEVRIAELLPQRRRRYRNS